MGRWHCVGEQWEERWFFSNLYPSWIIINKQVIAFVQARYPIYPKAKCDDFIKDFIHETLEGVKQFYADIEEGFRCLSHSVTCEWGRRGVKLSNYQKGMVFGLLLGLPLFTQAVDGGWNFAFGCSAYSCDYMREVLSCREGKTLSRLTYCSCSKWTGCVKPLSGRCSSWQNTRTMIPPPPVNCCPRCLPILRQCSRWVLRVLISLAEVFRHHRNENKQCKLWPMYWNTGMNHTFLVFNDAFLLFNDTESDTDVKKKHWSLRHSPSHLLVACCVASSLV